MEPRRLPSDDLIRVDEEAEYDPCVWIDSEMHWSTSCGKAFNIIDGTPSENGFKFCVYCGKVIQEGLFYHRGDV